MKNLKSLVCLGLVSGLFSLNASATTCTDFVSGVALDYDSGTVQVEHAQSKFNYFNMGDASGSSAVALVNEATKAMYLRQRLILKFHETDSCSTLRYNKTVPYSVLIDTPSGGGGGGGGGCFIQSNEALNSKDAKATSKAKADGGQNIINC
ncbi:MAG: hypothetical protein ACI8WB_004222 [Phenylobacterium sp.]|jgi:hypothetical protein